MNKIEKWNDKAFVLEAVKKNGSAIEYASGILKDDKDFVLEAVKHMNMGDLLGYSYLECPELGAETIKKLWTVKETDGALQFISERLKNDRDVASEVFKIVSEILRKFRSGDTNYAAMSGAEGRNATVLTHGERNIEEEPIYQVLSQAKWSLVITIVSVIVAVAFPAFFIVATFTFFRWVSLIYSPEYANERYIKTTFIARQEKLKKEKRELALEEQKEKYRQNNEKEYAIRRQLRAEIEKMPKYSNWRKAVYEKCGRACEMCGETKGLEIHHRTSFDAILRGYQIKTILQSFECDALWAINNGSVLCKQCHEKMESSKYRNLHGQ